jgi:hypothetical protein
MTYKIDGRGRSGAGLGSFALTRDEMVENFTYWLDRLRAGEFADNSFQVVWDQSDEPHVFTRDPRITDERVCRICEDTEQGNAENHVSERRLTGSAKPGARR